MKNKIYYYLFSLLFIGLNTACKKELPESNSVNNAADIAVVDGTLRFKNEDIFIKTVNLIVSSSHEQLDEWEKQFPAFTSSRTIFNRANDEFSKVSSKHDLESFLSKYDGIASLSKDSSLLSDIAPPLQSTMANSKGQFYVGNTLHILTKNAEISIENPTSRNIAHALSNTISDEKLGIVAQDYRGRLITKFSKVSTHPNDGFSYRVKEDGFYNNDRNRRLFCTYYFNPYTHTLYFEILQQKKSWFGWNVNSTGISVFNRVNHIYGVYNSAPDINVSNTQGFFVEVIPEYSAPANSVFGGSANVNSGGVPQTNYTFCDHSY